MFKNIFFVGGANFINAILSFIFFAAVAKLLSLEDFGTYSLCITTLLFLNKLTELGTTSSYVTLSIKNNKNYDIHLIKLKTILVTISSIGAVIFLSYSKLFNLEFLLIFILGIILYALADLYFAFFQKDEKYVLATLVNLVPAIVKGIFAYYFIFILNTTTLTNSLYVYAFSLATFVFFIPFKQITSKGLATKLEAKELFTLGVFGGISQTVTLLIPTLNSQFLYWVSNASDTGLFSFAEKISSIFIVASVSIFTVLLPNKSKEFKTTKQFDFTQVYILAFLIGLAGLFMMIVSQPTISILFDGKFQDSVIILHILIFSQALSAISSFMDAYFYILNKTVVSMNINLLKAIVVIGLNIILFERYGLYGVAYANVIGSVAQLMLITANILANEKFARKFN